MSRARTSALLALTCAALSASAGTAGAQGCAGADTPAVAGNEAQMGQATLCLLNAQRTAAGLPALAESPLLDQSSTAYSGQMVAERFFDHVSPEGVSLVPRLTAVGYLPGNGPWFAGENIAWGQGALATPQSIMTAWMNSQGHRENILSANFAEVGVGVAIGSPRGDMTASATYTTDFGRRVAAATDSSLSTYTPPAASTGVTIKRSTTTRESARARALRLAQARCVRLTAARHHGHISHAAALRACRAVKTHPRRSATR
jgi:uncharacterized protein YkwD